ncbi:MAG: hypothetical protein AB7G17_01115 [Phycisphaerales bacterium]
MRHRPHHYRHGNSPAAILGKLAISLAAAAINKAVSDRLSRRADTHNRGPRHRHGPDDPCGPACVRA